MEDLSGLPEYSDRWKTMKAATSTPLEDCIQVGVIGTTSTLSADERESLHKAISVFAEYERPYYCLIVPNLNSDVYVLTDAIAKNCIISYCLVQEKNFYDDLDALIVVGTLNSTDAVMVSMFKKRNPTKEIVYA